MIKQSDVEKALVSAGICPTRRDAQRAVQLCAQNLNRIETDDLKQALRKAGFACASDIACMVRPFLVEKRDDNKRRLYGYAPVEASRTRTPTAQPALYITKSGPAKAGWNITKAQYEKCVYALMGQHPAMSYETASNMMDTIMTSQGTEGWEAELA